MTMTDTTSRAVRIVNPGREGSARAQDRYLWSTPKSAAFMFALIALGLFIATLLEGAVK